ncbi:uncharacterized protein LOC115586545 [Sparus aurata]|uniref:uncharacterized protein LOC115586545 n=1 Tax=Sparus aurata TaxID=8175 RepID=UPI0011C152B6|nr:uncharacterized protein LOC115586545 [Sparus aurata]
MSAASCLLTEDQFLCSICLDVFTDPVSTPCGHNFCKTCITQHWDINKPYKCPNCKKVFYTRPELQVNTFISEMAAQFRQSAQQKASSSSSEQQVSKPGEVPCDVCTGTKLKTLKSCLVCLASYCETHLEPHLTKSGLKRHQLIDPVENLEDRMCTKHDKLLELFCKTDQMCVCMLCTVLDHQGHSVVPLKEEYEGKKAELGKRDAEIQQMIQKRRLKIEKMKRSVELSKKDVDREIAAGVQVFSALKESVERSQAELIDTIKEKQRETEKQAEGFIKELEQEISELEKRSSEVEKLSQSEDHLHLVQSFPSLNTIKVPEVKKRSPLHFWKLSNLLQSFPSLNAAPPTKDWTGVSIPPPVYEETMVRAVNQLEQTLSNQMKKLPKMKRVQQYAVDVTLDPDTAHPKLILSDDGKQVKHGDVKKNLPDNPERFNPCVDVLAKQSFSSGRFYHEVQVKEKTEWDLGVARESINRKGVITPSPQDGYWTICLRNKNEHMLLLTLVSVSSWSVRPEKNMSAASCLLTEDQFLCSICLDVFTDPVAIPCGHNFCKTCITQHWDINVPYKCPNCKEVFNMRPKLQVNNFLSEMAAQFRQSAQQKASSSSSELQVSKPGEVPCDDCTGTKLKALKSCLVCLASYCETHLEPHLTKSGLKRHQLIDPVENLEDRMCTKHDKLLELFCKTDQMCVCMLCSISDHQRHSVVPLKEEYEGKKAELGKTYPEIQQMIEKRRMKIQQTKRSVELSKKDADREIAAGVQVFSALKESVERSQAELIDTIKEKQRETEKQAEGFIKELEQEISELKKRSSEVEQLSQSEDHLHLVQSFPSLNTIKVPEVKKRSPLHFWKLSNLLQSFPSLNAAPPTKDWIGVSVPPPVYEETMVRAVNQLEETLSKQMKKLPELKRVQQYAVDVTLDPDTAHPKLILSDDGKQVKHGDVKKKLPDNPERFNPCVDVLAKQSFSSGRFYYEVQVKEKTEWDLGVARESINRKGVITPSPQDGYWTICLRNKNEHKACADPSVSLPLERQPEKVGVFVDYEEGLVSFYDVDAAALIYSFTGCCFTQKLYPFFSPCLNDGGENSAPLIISPVNHTE